MTRFITFNEALKTAAEGRMPRNKDIKTQAAYLATYFLTVYGVGKEVDQKDVMRDLMRVQFLTDSEGGVLPTISDTSLTKIFELHRQKLAETGAITVRVVEDAKPEKVPGKLKLAELANAKLTARVAELEAALAASYEALKEYQAEHGAAQAAA